jgi:tetratricopeptide (TPR) repeat protein
LLDVVRLLEQEERSRAIPRLLHVMTKYPETQASIDSEYFLARTYQEIASYREAIDLYNEYLRLAPDGQFAEQSHDALAVLVEEYERNFWTAERLNRQIAEVSQRLERDPGNVQWQLELRGSVLEAGQLRSRGRGLYEALNRCATGVFADDATIRGRIEPVPSGGYSP